MQEPSHADTDQTAAMKPGGRPAYMSSDLYDPPEALAHWPRLAPLLRTWQTEVWEKDHTDFRGALRYDLEAQRLQRRHKWFVILAAIGGTAAVVLAILQLGMEHYECGCYLGDVLGGALGSPLVAAVMRDKATHALMVAEVVCVLVAIAAIVPGLVSSLDHRWRELRFKAEHYRMLKFRFLLNGAWWLRQSDDERGKHLFLHLAQIHAIDKQGVKDWIGWKREVLPPLEAPDVEPDAGLALELADYFRERRFADQQRYFARRGHELHRVERVVRWFGPGLFLISVVFALLHGGIEVFKPHEDEVECESLATAASSRSPGAAKAAEVSRRVGRSPHAPSRATLFAFAFALIAASAPVVAAGFRTWRGAFEFGRNSLRFESMAHHLQHLLGELADAKSPEAILTILRRGEYAMEGEHRAWMRLMTEAEWFG